MLKPYCFAWLAGLCLLLASPLAQAQRLGGGSSLDYVPAEETPWSHLIDSLTAPLDKSQIPSGILYDRALSLATLHSFAVRWADTTSNAHLRQAYLELWMATYNRSRIRVQHQHQQWRVSVIFALA